MQSQPPSYKDDFYSMDGACYLNCANQGPMPKVGIEAVKDSLQYKMAPQRISSDLYFTLPDTYRAGIAELLGCQADQVAITDSTTYGVSLLTQGLDWQAGDEVLIPHGEFPANRFPWMALQKRGVVLKEIELPSGAAAVDALKNAITEKTRVVSLAWVTYASGARRDLKALGDVARAAGALFVVDGSQAAGAHPLNLSTTPCDLFVCSGYKWMLGPYGLGFAVLSPQLRDRLEPATINWFALEGASNFGGLDECTLKLAPGARKFDINETANFFNLSGGIASLQYVLGIGPETVENHVSGLLDRLIAGLPDGFAPRDSGPLRSNILCIAGPDQATTDAAWKSLCANDVIASIREGVIRFSPHLYNTEQDMDHALNALREVLV
ncbi:MAG: hypothetical protein COA70_08865 [Planctomycetota bacterium]|nr:MAG: hypothetical protein COA70_08865 [Planctomycetota bacterium]